MKKMKLISDESLFKNIKEKKRNKMKYNFSQKFNNFTITIIIIFKEISYSNY